MERPTPVELHRRGSIMETEPAIPNARSARPLLVQVTVDRMLRDPIGKYAVSSGTSITWCASPRLMGAVLWGRPSLHDATRTLRAFESYRHELVAPHFAVVLDARAVEGVDLEALAVLKDWLVSRRDELASRVQMQVGVVADSIVGCTLCGILPLLGESHPFTVVHDPRPALRAISPFGDELLAQIEAAVAQARGIDDDLRRLREHLARGCQTTLEGAAHALGVAPRTLQRRLKAAGTSFRNELRDARFRRICELLIHGDDKVIVIAQRVGISEGALTQLVRDKSALTPAELRKSYRRHGG